MLVWFLLIYFGLVRQSFGIESAPTTQPVSSPSNGSDLSSAEKFLREHVWVAIIAAFAMALVVTLLVWGCCRKKSQRRGYDYTVLDGEVIGSRGFELSTGSDTVPQSFERKRKTAQEIETESALLNSQFYVRTLGGYALKTSLGQIGNRAGKRWYMLTETEDRTDCIMSMVGRSSQCPFVLSKTSVRTLQELMDLIRHPYILPVNHIGYALDQDCIVTIHRLFPKGSLKDQIHGAKPTEASHQKYQTKGRPVTEPLVQRFGRQILEALIFLRSKGFPPCLHLHAGNVFVEQKICRITGYELTLLGFPARLFTQIRRAVSSDNLDALEVVLFGHLIFEMAAGYDLNAAKPERQHYNAVAHSHQVASVLRFIFERDDGSHPTLAEVNDLDFFKFAHVPEFDRYNQTAIQLTAQMKSILKAARKGKPALRTGRGTKRSTEGSASSQKGSSTASAASTRAPSHQSSSRPSSRRVSTSAPPPAAPPPAAPPAPAAAAPPPSTRGRGALLGDIRQGTRLKKTKTNDRSAPRV